jgi:glycosyltransferase involved in cell wall biosynthesis
MRVAILTANAYAGDAIGNQVAEKVAFFLDRGAEVRVFSDSHHRLHPRVRLCCRPHSAAKPTPEEWVYLASADLVIAEYGQWYPTLGWLSAIAGGKPRILLDYYGITPPQLWGSHNREIVESSIQRRGIVWCADAVLTHSRFTRLELLAHAHFPSAHCYHSLLPIDSDRFFPGPPEDPIRHELGPRNAYLLLFVGRVAPNKRVAALVEAVARLSDVIPPVHAVVVGDTTDVYQLEMNRCLDRARQLDVADRIHFLGHVDDDRLRAVYRSADVFVMPSVHEGYCLPVMEALACGLRVMAARAGALPETVADAGLTFTPDDPDDLARQIRRLLPRDEGPGAGGKRPASGNPSSLAPHASTLWRPSCRRVAVVMSRYGPGFVGGAEKSLGVMAEALHRAGQHVEIFTTCACTETKWSDELPEGTETSEGIPVHRYRIEPHDPDLFQQAIRAIEGSAGLVSPEMEAQFLLHSLRSTRLLRDLATSREQFDAIIVGPYLLGLAFEVVRAFPEQTLLVPCFHAEPLARLHSWQQVYGAVGGILYHSPEEQDLAQADLGLNHPGGHCIGAYVDTARPGNAPRGRARVGADRPYLLYCGRYLVQKGLPVLLDYARRYSEERAGRFTFVFVGQGDVLIPRAPWARDLGFVADQVQRDVLAGAAALLHLSPYESLSLVALEAWCQGIPVLAHEHCAVLTGHLQRGRGGQMIADYESFAAALDDLWKHPEEWQARGRQGQDYVRRTFASLEGFTSRLIAAIDDLKVPLGERMRRQGLLRAAAHGRARWRQRFGEIIEDLLHQPARPHRELIEIRPRTSGRTVTRGQNSVLIPVRVINQGTHAILPDGAAQAQLAVRVLDAEDQPVIEADDGFPVPGLLMPGQSLTMAVPVAVPAGEGTYRVICSAYRTGGSGVMKLIPSQTEPLSLMVTQHNAAEPQQIPRQTDNPAHNARPSEGWCTSLLNAVQDALVEANRLQQLPENYIDVTQGRFASWKAWIKRKLLGNFKHAYVDVLSRQQSAFNRRVLAALQELAECCTTMDSLLEQLAASQQRTQALEERVAQLEKTDKRDPRIYPAVK